MISGIIFDFDGVLVQSERANIEAAIKTLDEMGKLLTKDEIARPLHESLKPQIRQFCVPFPYHAPWFADKACMAVPRSLSATSSTAKGLLK